jgi:Skp family chaperone for outer membrane proteins
LTPEGNKMLTKKLFICLAAILFTVTPTFADNIGFVDLEKILGSYEKAKEYQKELLEQREAYQEFFKERQGKLETAKEKKKSDKTIKKMIGEMEVELKAKQEKLFRFEAQFQRSILAEVTLASQKVAKEYGVDVVMDKRIIYVGGFDLTDFVLTKLNE